MTTTTTYTETYERLNSEIDSSSPADSDAENTPKQRIPNLFWAGAVLFAVNMLILVCMWLSPELSVNMYGEDSESVRASFRPSPLTETVLLAKHKPKLAAKVRPVLFEEPQATEFNQSADLLLPRSTQPSAGAPSALRPEQPVSGAAVHRVVENYSNYPRMTAGLTAVHAESVEIAPRRISERPVTHVSSND